MLQLLLWWLLLLLLLPLLLPKQRLRLWLTAPSALPLCTPCLTAIINIHCCLPVDSPVGGRPVNIHFSNFCHRLYCFLSLFFCFPVLVFPGFPWSACLPLSAVRPTAPLQVPRVPRVPLFLVPGWAPPVGRVCCRFTAQYADSQVISRKAVGCASLRFALLSP